MGAVTFYTYAFGGSARDAFDKAVEDAQYMNGHGPYTGTIAEKGSVTVIPDSEHKGKQKQKYASTLIDEADDRIDDKRGPAGAINISGTKKAKAYRERNGLKGKHGDVWLFFGWASS